MTLCTLSKIKSTFIILLLSFFTLIQAQEKIELSSYMNVDSFDQILPLVTGLQSQEKTINNVEWKIYSIPNPSPFTFYNFPIEELTFYIANNQMEIISFSLEKYDKNISKHPVFGVNPTTTEKYSDEEARKQYVDFLNDNSKITKAIIQKLNDQYAIIREDDDCSFDCGIKWQTDFGSIQLEKNNFTDRINKEQWLYIDSSISITRNRYDYSGL